MRDKGNSISVDLASLEKNRIQYELTNLVAEVDELRLVFTESEKNKLKFVAQIDILKVERENEV